MKATVDKVAAWVAVIGFVAVVVLAYANLNNRLDGMDAKIAGIEKMLGSATCNSILTRQMEAIEKNRAEPRRALEALSAQYDCLPHKGDFNASWAGGAVNVSAAMSESDARNLAAQLNAIDVQLNNQH